MSFSFYREGEKLIIRDNSRPLSTQRQNPQNLYNKLPNQPLSLVVKPKSKTSQCIFPLAPPHIYVPTTCHPNKSKFFLFCYFSKLCYFKTLYGPMLYHPFKWFITEFSQYNVSAIQVLKNLFFLLLIWPLSIQAPAGKPRKVDYRYTHVHMCLCMRECVFILTTMYNNKRLEIF